MHRKVDDSGLSNEAFAVALDRHVSEVDQMDVVTLSGLLDSNAGKQAQFVDVREPHEEAMAALPRFRLMPLSR